MKTALVSGGARGIGEQIVRALCAEGFRVAFCYRDSHERAHALSEELCAGGAQVLALQCDVSCAQEVARLFAQVRETFGPPAVLVNNAGVAQQKLFTDISDTDWDRMLGTNLSGAFYCCREAVPDMVRQKYGRIINITSMWGQVGASCEVHYSAAKAGLAGLTKALAKELALSGITVNCVAPGAIETDMLGTFSQHELDALCAEIPVGRLGRATEIAGMVRFLVSDTAAYITGQEFGINGGYV